MTIQRILGSQRGILPRNSFADTTKARGGIEREGVLNRKIQLRHHSQLRPLLCNETIQLVQGPGLLIDHSLLPLVNPFQLLIQAVVLLLDGQ